jgi:hypothetical protein
MDRVGIYDHRPYSPPVGLCYNLMFASRNDAFGKGRSAMPDEPQVREKPKRVEAQRLKGFHTMVNPLQGTVVCTFPSRLKQS